MSKAKTGQQGGLWATRLSIKVDLLHESGGNKNKAFTCGTGFLVNGGSSVFLITNRHVVTGRNNFDKSLMDDGGRVPARLKLWHLNTGSLSEWDPRVEELYDAQNQPRWIEHPSFGGLIDVVALPIVLTENLWKEARVNFFENDDERIDPLSTLSIAGFPYGRHSVGALPTWITGYAASEPDFELDCDQFHSDIGLPSGQRLPAFLLDARSREGMSGSPVWFHTKTAGEFNIVPVGVYSGRITSKSDLAIVWKKGAVKELIEHATAKAKSSDRAQGS